jgi:hypothetical protein
MSHTGQTEPICDDLSTSISETRTDGSPIEVADYGLRFTFESLPPLRSTRRHPFQAVVWLIEAIVGVVCLVTLLVLAATIPVINLITLGYIMEVQGRVARTGRLRDALPLLPAARCIGLMAMWIVLLLLPLGWLGGAASDVWLISPGSVKAWLWAIGLSAAALVVTIHLLLALARGGGFWSFLRPIKNFHWFRAQLLRGGYGERAAHVLQQFLAALQLPQHLRLASLAYVGVYLWLAMPTVMFTAVADSDGLWQRLITMVGGLCLVPPLMWLPFLLTHCAAERRFRALFELGAIRELFRQAPFILTMASIVLYGMAFLPLFYCAKWKAEMPPHETMWDVMLIFLVTIYPAKVLLGWAYHRAKVGRQAWRPWRWVNQTVLCAAVGLYILLLYLVQTAGLLGHRAVWQHRIGATVSLVARDREPVFFADGGFVSPNLTYAKTTPDPL